MKPALMLKAQGPGKIAEVKISLKDPSLDLDLIHYDTSIIVR